jgi:ABC-type transport system substrate-binding protein
VPDLRVNYIAFDTRRAPFADVRVRRAFGMAVDRHHLATALMFGYEVAASAGFVPAHAGLSSQVPGDGLPYAPARAQELLAEAGFAGGRGLPVIDLWGGQGSGSWTAAGEYLAQQWQQVLGARVERRTVARHGQRSHTPGSLPPGRGHPGRRRPRFAPHVRPLVCTDQTACDQLPHVSRAALVFEGCGG